MMSYSSQHTCLRFASYKNDLRRMAVVLVVYNYSLFHLVSGVYFYSHARMCMHAVYVRSVIQQLGQHINHQQTESYTND
jgi:hypothetical protein